MFKHIILIASIFLTFFVCVIYLNNPRSRTTKGFLYLGLVITFWLNLYYLAFSQLEKESAIWFFKLGYIWIIIIPVVFYNFICSFLEKRIYFKWVLLFLFLFFLILLFFTNKFITGLYLYSWGYYPKVNPFTHIPFLIYFISVFSFGITLLVLNYLTYLKEKKFTLQKEKIKYVLLGSLIGSLGAVDFLPNYGINIYPFGAIAMLVYPLFFAYAIFRYRLMDVNLIITKASIFIIVYLFVLGIPFFMVNFLKYNFIRLLGDNWWLMVLFTSTFLATVGPFVYLYIDKKAEDKLLKEQKNYQNILRNASSGMIRIKDLNHLLNLIVRVVAKTVRIKHAFIYLLDEENQKYKLTAFKSNVNITDVSSEIELGSSLIWQLTSKREPIVTEEEIMKVRDDSSNIAIESMVKQLVSLHASLLIPSFVEDRLVGILVLGEKRSGKVYSQDDINVFSVLANQAALAIENAQFYEEIKQTHEQLFQAEKMATIGTMADGLSHQINNRFHALSLIAGDSLDMLKTFDWSSCNEGTKQVMADLKSALERIENNVLQGGEIVKGILKYSRPGDSGFESVDFKDVLNGAIEMLQYKIRLKEIDLVQNIPADLPKLHGNLTQLQEVFFNMIDNAYDAIKERQMTLKEEGYRGKIEVTADRSSNSLEIRVTDNGIGVKDLDKKKLFTPFFTTKATAKKGTGLGLYVIEKIIASHNGKIDIESTYKSGTRFIIILPTTPSAT